MICSLCDKEDPTTTKDYCGHPLCRDCAYKNVVSGMYVICPKHFGPECNRCAAFISRCQCKNRV